ncbi:13648_t:CDS:2 [Funneliformis mosseae]|uniref:13648_t:CDS:1 n=1 Tax=Funneliformis mosseae TaxID=27381 RepID=A0A9N8V8V9_FUNMO|nr:13648_t:CDS:2 [Funneliformis mosseae]
MLQVLDSDIQPSNSSTSKVSENVNLSCPISDPVIHNQKRVSGEAGHVSEISETACSEKILPEVNTPSIPQITPAKADNNDLTDLKEEDFYGGGGEYHDQTTATAIFTNTAIVTNTVVFPMTAA